MLSSKELLAVRQCILPIDLIVSNLHSPEIKEKILPCWLLVKLELNFGSPNEEVSFGEAEVDPVVHLRDAAFTPVTVGLEDVDGVLVVVRVLADRA